MLVEGIPDIFMEQKEFLHTPLGESLEIVLEELGAAERILVVTERNVFEKTGAQKICDDVLCGKEVVIFDNFSPNPTIEEVALGIETWRQVRPDLVIAVGGGSSIDMAKAINILAAHDGVLEDYVTGARPLQNRSVRLVAVPTTTGTGSEATHFAVVYINNIKYSLAHAHMLPDYAVVDSTLTHSLPKPVAASTGLDALSQAIESYWSVGSTEESKVYAQNAITLCMEHLVHAVNEGDSLSRRAMSEAAYLSGKAINISKTTASHAMSYPLTKHFGIPHGHAVALTLPELIRFNAEVSEVDVADARGITYVKDTLGEINTFLGAKSADEAADVVRNLVATIGLETRLGACGVVEGDIQNLLPEMSLERAKNNPRMFAEADALFILTKVL